MASITGLGGIFLRANDPKALYAWYEQHLGIGKTDGAYYLSAPNPPQIIFSLFKQENDYFPTSQKAMLNLQVDDLHSLLDKLAADGVSVDDNRVDDTFGKFGWITDPEGNRIELWQPAAE